MAYEPEPRQWEQKDWLYEKYWGEMLTTREIADKVGMGKRTICKQFDQLGIPRRIIGYRPDNTVSPFAGFYNGDEVGQTDEQSRKHFDPDVERGEPEDLMWQKDARNSEMVSEKAVIDSQ